MARGNDTTSFLLTVTEPPTGSAQFQTQDGGHGTLPMMFAGLGSRCFGFGVLGVRF